MRIFLYGKKISTLLIEGPYYFSNVGSNPINAQNS